LSDFSKVCVSVEIGPGWSPGGNAGESMFGWFAALVTGGRDTGAVGEVLDVSTSGVTAVDPVSGARARQTPNRTIVAPARNNVISVRLDIQQTLFRERAKLQAAKAFGKRNSDNRTSHTRNAIGRRLASLLNHGMPTPVIVHSLRY
jgi:hypothetical protein